MKKRILFINNSSKVGIGTSTVLLQLIDYLHNEFDIAVVSDKQTLQLPDALDRVHIPHCALPDRFVQYLPAVVKVILRGKFDLIYANGSNERSRGAFWASRLTHKPFIWHIHESLRSSTYSHTFRFADAVIANSHDTAERIRRYANGTNPIVIHNGVTIKHFDLDKQISKNIIDLELDLKPDWMRVINVGRICQDKNQVDVINIAVQVLVQYPNTYFIILGNNQDPDYLIELKNIVKQKNLQKNIIFHDYASNVGDYLCSSDLMLHTALREPQGLVILEAMAAKLPVVAYKVGGVGESIVDGETGFLLPPGDVNGLAQVVCRLLGSQDERQRMGILGYQRAKDNFSTENMAQSVRIVINTALENQD
jgi:glycosyltransferase involved in cell wall biosynthesis